MLPPGLAFNAISAKARAASATARMPRAYWDWEDMLANADAGFFPYTPATNLLYGLEVALELLREEGLEAVFARHARHAEATRRAVDHWGLELWASEPAERSDVLTVVLMPDDHDADRVRDIALDRFDLSLGTGLAHLKGRVFRIGHLGDLNDLMLAGTLAGVEAALGLAEVPIRTGGVETAMAYLAAH
jgi:alanine-glyoxylate transaminase/serine-glyoxylate transaminase/serine-pyruvate transaminase